MSRCAHRETGAPPVPLQWQSWCSRRRRAFPHCRFPMPILSPFPLRARTAAVRGASLVTGRLAAALALALAWLPGVALSAPQDAAAGGDTATDLAAALVVAERASRVSNGATNLDLAIKDTPQSISVVSSEQMRQFGASSVNDALRLATGVRVDEWETNRTSYSARGFDILNTQIDGVGLPN